MKTEYQTITFSGITLTPEAQNEISFLQTDINRDICESIDRAVLVLCESSAADAAYSLELVRFLLWARRAIFCIGSKEEE